MKRTLLLLLLLSTIIIAQSSTETNLHMKDTVITKTVNDGFFSYQLWQNIISVIIGSVLTLAGVYYVNKHHKKIFVAQTKHQQEMLDEQIQHQLKVAQSQITAEHREKWLEGFRKYTAMFNEHVSSANQYLIPKQGDKISLSEKEEHDLDENLMLIRTCVFNLEIYLTPRNIAYEDIVDEIKTLAGLISSYYQYLDEIQNDKEINKINKALDIIKKSIILHQKLLNIISDEERQIEHII